MPKLQCYNQTVNYFLIIITGFIVFSCANPVSPSGGPKDVKMLYSKEEIRNDFPAFEILKLCEEITELDEGIYHNGKSAVIRFVGRKK